MTNIHFGSWVAQWLILAALWLSIRRETGSQWASWLALIVVTALTCIYLWAMVMALWCAHLLRLWIGRAARPMSLGVMAANSLAVSLLCFWTTGVFIMGVGDAASGGNFGVFLRCSMNLSSPINPLWMPSLLAKRPVAAPGQMEGMTYLGAGMLIVCFWVLYTLLVRRPQFSWPIVRSRGPLVLVCLAMAVFALSTRITIDQHVLFEYQFPEFLRPVCQAFRSPGRFAWPAYYLLIYAVLLAFVALTPRRIAVGLLGGALFVQAIDFSATAHCYDSVCPDAPVWRPLQSPKWRLAAAQYRHVAMVPQSLSITNYETLAEYAGTHRMTFNTGYFSRVDWSRFLEAAIAQEKRIQEGRFDPQTIYVINDAKVLETLQRDLKPPASLEQLDGYQVFFPNGLAARNENCDRTCGTGTHYLTHAFSSSGLARHWQRGH